MLSCQPSQTTISTNDFQNGVYTFSVESVLEAILPPGRLVVSASAGYLLTTLSTNLSRREHTFEHKQQANGSWLANGRVTILCNNEIPTDGKVIIQNSQSESVILTIAATSDSIEHTRLPALAVTQSNLAFAPTTPGKPSFLVFNITPQETNTPVTLTTDSPEVFQLASNSRPNFGSALTVTPSLTGTYVHIRYISSKSGIHSGQLLLHTGSETKSVALTAYTNRLLPNVLMRARQPTLRRLFVVIGTALVVGSLAFAGYGNRCQLFPTLCQDRIAHQNAIKTDGPVFNLTGNRVVAANKPGKPGRVQKNRTKTARSLTPPLAKGDTINEDISSLTPDLQVVDNSHQSKMLPPNTDKSKPTARRANQQSVVTPTQESDLERALNHPIPN